MLTKTINVSDYNNFKIFFQHTFFNCKLIVKIIPKIKKKNHLNTDIFYNNLNGISLSLKISFFLKYPGTLLFK